MSKMRKPNQAETQALREGDAAARAGKTYEDCPYRDAIALRFMWLTGHQNAMGEIEAKRKQLEAAENQRKLDAFPDLLAACKVAFDQTCQVGRPKDWEQLRSAIAKATGAAS